MFKFNSVPAYSIGKARPKHHDDSLPGPGAYNTNKLIDIKEKHVGTTVLYKPSTSKSVSKTNEIGPGAYNVNMKGHVKGYYHGKSKGDRQILKNNDTPGPGQYNYDQFIQKFTKSNHVVFDKTKKNRQDTSLPVGPGQYDTQKYTMFEGKNKAWSFNKAKNTKDNENTIPGPGSYNSQKYYDSRDKGPGFSLTKASKFKGLKNNTPGPGMYNNEIRAFSNRGHHFPKSQEKAKIEEIPGPGHYDPNVNKLKDKAPGIKFEKTDKLNKIQNIPGPGQYENKLSAFTSKGAIFNKSKRENTRNDDKPAPGHYNIPLIDKPIGIVFDKQAVRNFKINSIPGPGQYNYEEKHKAKFALPKASKKTETNEVPGPGHYNTKFDDWNKRVPGFDRTGRLGKENTLPVGPGHYNIPHSIPDVPKYNYPDVSQRKIHI